MSPWLRLSQNVHTSKTSKASKASKNSKASKASKTSKASKASKASKTIKAALECYALHSYVGTAFGDDKLLAEQHLSSRNGDKSSEDGVWLSMWHGNKNSHTGIPLSPHRIHLSMYSCIYICQCSVA